VLSRVGNLYERDRNASLTEACELARQEYPLYREWAEVRERVHALLDKKELSRYFSVREGRVLTEQEIITQAGETRRIDRLVICPGDITVIDFKSSRENVEESRRQLRGYVEIIASMYPRHRARGVLIYFDTLESEEFPES
jgi:ATP-dependent exoDNAse (exonuclease V) beta subunit